MAKVLITADVHIHDYRNHNLFNKPTFRLDQFHLLAQRLVQIIQLDPTIEALIIAGDFLHVAAPRPYVTNRAFSFLDYIAQWCPIYLTHGQHDVDTRREGISGNTLLSLCNLHTDVHYLHQDEVGIGGRSFYFLGWVPNTENHIAHLADCGGTDVFIGHFQPGTVRVGQRNFLLTGGRTVPENPPWQIAFVGDIHTHQTTKGSIVIPGVPLMHTYNDGPHPGIILLDTETLGWQHIETRVPGEWDFLRLLIDDDPTAADEWTVIRPATVTVSRQLQKTFEKRLDVGAVIEEQVRHHHLEYIHKEILTGVSNEVRQDVDLQFTLEKLIIHDFRSIGHFEWDHIGEGVTLLFGLNGTGKSSLVSALIYALTGEGSGRSLIRKGSNNMFVEVTLSYGGLQHTLRRGWSTSGKIRYWINDVEQQAENQRALVEKIGDNLPFLRFIDLFYHQQDRPGFLSSYNYAARVDLIARVLGLRIVQALCDEVQKRLLALDRQLANLRAQIATITAIVEQETLVDFTFKEVVDDGKETHLKILRDSLRSLAQAERHKTNTTSAKKATLTRGIERETQEITTLARQRDQLARRACYTCGQNINDGQFETLFNQICTNITTKTTNCDQWQSELDGLEIPTPDIVKQLEDRFEHTVAQLSEFESQRQHQVNILRLKTHIEGAKNDLRTLVADESVLLVQRERLSDYKTLLAPTGPIMRTLLITLSDILSSDQLRVRAHKQLVSGEIRPDFDIEVNVSGSWIPFDEISGGQKTVADLVLLGKIIQLAGGLGCIIFDETFKFLDTENLEKSVEVLKHMHCSSIFVISHIEGFPYFDTSIQTSVNTDNLTEYIIR